LSIFTNAFHLFSGAKQTLHTGSQISVTGTGEIVLGPTGSDNASLLLKNGSTVKDSTWTENDASTITRTGPTTQSGTITLSGNDAYTILRTVDVPDSNSTVVASRKDLIRLAPPTANRTLRLGTPPGAAVVGPVAITVDALLGYSFVWTIKDDDSGTTLLEIGNTGDDIQYLAGIFYYMGSRWYCFGSSATPPA
jgi:hypothetical protein